MWKSIREKIGADGHLKELLTGSLISFLLKMSGMLLAYIGIYLISMKTGPEGVGIYSIINQTLLVLAAVATWGTGTSVLRYVGQHHAKNPGFLHLLRAQLSIIILPLSVLTALVLYLSASFIAQHLFHNAAYTEALQISALLLPFFAINAVDIEFLRGLKILQLSEFFRSVFRPLLLVGTLLVLWNYALSPLDVIYIFCAIVLLSAVSSAGFLHLALRKLPRTTEVNTRIPEILRTSGPMMLSGISSTFMTALPLFWVQYAESTSSAGIYGVAMRLSTLISLVLIVVNTMSAPKFSALYWNKEIAALQRLLRQSAKLLFWGSLILSAGMIALSTPLLKLFGEAYTAGYWALLILIIGHFINAASGSVGLLLNMSGHQKILRNSAFLSLGVQVVLLFLLIPHYGMVGGALAFTLSSSLWNLICILFTYRKMKLRTYYIPFIH